jgi:hypothetical protein
MGNSETSHRIVEIGPGFYNVRATFRGYGGLVDIGTHMSLIRLSHGGFLVIDTVPLDKTLKAELDALTDNGNRIEAVLATHPFHSLAFPGFHDAYPNPQYIGTPRHLRFNQQKINWIADISSPQILNRWAPDVQMRIPAGSEFKLPKPEKVNHFSTVWVFHKPSKTIHVDDTVNYFYQPDALMKMAGKKHDLMEFHMCMSGPGLYSRPDAPAIFKKWIEAILNDWDFENMCCAHTGNKIGGAKPALREALKNAEPIFKKLEKKHADKPPIDDNNITAEDEEEYSKCENYNVNGGTECG